MKIKQVEELVGITSKNIRFYEEQGLLTPERAENGYREYHDPEIRRLKLIRLLRTFDVSVEEIRMVFEGRKSLADCLDRHIEQLRRGQENLKHMELLAERILEENPKIDALDADRWLDEVYQMEREGVEFVNLKQQDVRKRRKMGALAGGAVFIALMLFYIGLMTFAFVIENMPLWTYLLMVLIPLAIIICLVVVIVGRIKEINGGEQDEASKY